MNKNERIAQYLADAYVSMIDDDDLEYEPFDRLLETIEVLPADVASQLMINLDMCPKHYCDLAICDDDELNCRERYQL